jgi:hypothetical protein
MGNIDTTTIFIALAAGLGLTAVLTFVLVKVFTANYKKNEKEKADDLVKLATEKAKKI